MIIKESKKYILNMSVLYFIYFFKLLAESSGDSGQLLNLV